MPYLVLLVPLILLSAIVKSAWFKGKAGEFLVSLLFRIFLPKTKYHVIHNVTLPTEDGTTQIDHILVSRLHLQDAHATTGRICHEGCELYTKQKGRGLVGWADGFNLQGH